MWKRNPSTVQAVFQLALLAAVIYLVRETARVERLSRQQHVVVKPVAVPAIPPKVITLTRTNDFHWAQLESEDYRTYIARLRAVGCPEETICDLIIADVDKLLAPRLHAVVPPRKELAYWQSEEKELEDPLAAHEMARQQMEIDFEKRDLIKELVGVDLVAERLKLRGELDQYGQRLSFLPEEQRMQLRKILERFNHAEIMLREKAWAEGETSTPESEAEIRQLQQKRESEITALLTPEELQKYELRLSPTAYKTRDALFGMNASEKEYLAIFQVQKGLEEKLAGLDPSKPFGQQEAEAAHLAMQEQLRQQLGEKRYQEYERAQDADFRELCAAAARNQLPRSAAEQVYEIKRIAEARREEIATNPDFSAEQKGTVQQQIAQETERTVRGVLGDKAFLQFIRRSKTAWWLP